MQTSTVETQDQGARVIPLSDALVRDLRKLKETSTNTLVFPAPRGGVEFHFLRILQDLGDKAGVTGVKCHRFRDTYITDKVQEGVDLLTLRKWVGHENLETLKLYTARLSGRKTRGHVMLRIGRTVTRSGLMLWRRTESLPKRG